MSRRQRELVLQRGLLLLPLNLAVFLESGMTSNKFNSRDDLFENLVKQKSKSLSGTRELQWTLMQPLEALADWMSNSQRLDAPLSILDDFNNAVDLLSSEGLIIHSKDKLNFFHESFFDFVFARAFVTKRKSLKNLLIDSEQHLFRRTQVRQIIEILRAQDFQTYLNELEFILTSADIRYHIKLAVAQWLGSVSDPKLAEFNIVTRLDTRADGLSPLFRCAALGSAGWFDLLLRNNTIVPAIRNQMAFRGRVFLNWLSSVSEHRPGAIASLLRDWWYEHPDAGLSILNWMTVCRRIEDTEELETLCLDIIKTRPSYLFSNEIRTDLGIWTKKDSEETPHVLQELFETWFEQHPNQHPFEEKQGHASFDFSHLQDIEKKAPIAFLEGVIPALVKAGKVAETRPNDKYYGDFFVEDIAYRRSTRQQDVIDLVINALDRLSTDNPTNSLHYLRQLSPDQHAIFMYVHLKAIRSSPEALKDHFLHLIKTHQILGRKLLDWKHFAGTARVVFPFLSLSEKTKIESVILNHTTEIERAVWFAKRDMDAWKAFIGNFGGGINFTKSEYVVNILNRNGYEQWCILKTIGSEQLTKKAITEFHQLERKFHDEEVDDCVRIRTGWSGTPITLDACVRMSDQGWLQAIEKYSYSDSDEFVRGRGFNGGAHELSRQLQEITKEHPLRFAKLLHRIPDSANSAYVEGILWGLRECESMPLVEVRGAIKDAFRRPNQNHNRSISWLIQKSPELVEEDEVFDILRSCLEDDDGEDELRDEHSIKENILSIDDLIHTGHSIRVRSLNTVRGQAAEALTSILWNVPTRYQEAKTLLIDRIRNEPFVGVRCFLLEAITPIYNEDRQECGKLVLDLIENARLFQKEKSDNPFLFLSPLVTRAGIYLLDYLLVGAPDPGQKLLRYLENSGDETFELVATWHVARNALWNKEYEDWATQRIALNDKHREIIANSLAFSVPGAEKPEWGKKILKQFFNDPLKSVRQNASKIFEHCRGEKTIEVKGLMEVYVESDAFDGSDYDYFKLLSEVNFPVTDFVIRSVERVLEWVPDEDGQKYGYRDLSKLTELINNEYVNSEYDPDLRSRILDIIDLLLEKEIHQSDTILETHDRAS